MVFLLAHRLRDAFIANLLERVAGLIVEQSEDFLREAGVILPPRAVSTVLLLGELGRLSAADIGRELSQPHQLVTQRLELLISLALIGRANDPGDARRRLVHLTELGQDQFQKLQSCLARADYAFGQVFKEIGCDLTDACTKTLEALERTPLTARTLAAHA